METAARIRRHIHQLVDDKPFSIRDFLTYGSRAAIDQVFRRLVISGEIIRVARGLYIKNTAPFPSVLEVAKAKAAAFRKSIASHGSKTAFALRLTSKASGRHVFAVTGHSSSFRFGNKIIYFIGMCARKMHLLNEPVGLVIRALWYLGERQCNTYVACAAVKSFGRSDREKLRQSIDLMPDWMRRLFPSLLSLGQWQALGLNLT
jgi:hypothetical protein